MLILRASENFVRTVTALSVLLLSTFFGSVKLGKIIGCLTNPPIPCALAWAGIKMGCTPVWAKWPRSAQWLPRPGWKDCALAGPPVWGAPSCKDPWAQLCCAPFLPLHRLRVPVCGFSFNTAAIVDWLGQRRWFGPHHLIWIRSQGALPWDGFWEPSKRRAAASVQKHHHPTRGPWKIWFLILWIFPSHCGGLG